eukprot:gnl/Trimastix_PCT/3950.p1 GENE.gnl/Trimastix_PCT/3950~~gnl/Trimastix_PCT/3950.p1  ORF type:complete len:372 (+),score=18.82 gnl/Trimastix_PCT/3950:56-1117(+)
MEKPLCRDCGIHHDPATPHTFSYVGSPNDHLSCGLCLDVMIDPFMCPHCEQIGCKICLVRAIQSQGCKCPFCRKGLDPEGIRRASVPMRRMLDELEVRCPHCPATVQRAQLRTHLAECPSLELPCPYADAGCTHRAAAQGLDDHRRECPFRLAHERLTAQAAHIQDLTEALESQRSETKDTRRRVGRLEREMQEHKRNIRSLTDQLQHAREQLRAHEQRAAAPRANAHPQLSVLGELPVVEMPPPGSLVSGPKPAWLATLRKTLRGRFPPALIDQMAARAVETGWPVCLASYASRQYHHASTVLPTLRARLLADFRLDGKRGIRAVLVQPKDNSHAPPGFLSTPFVVLLFVTP